MRFAIGNADKRGDVAPQVQQRVHLHGGLVPAELGPGEQRKAQVDGGRVQSVETLINSPVGAVSSASDVTQDRCLEKIEHAIDRGDGGNLKRTLEVLAEANRVTATAGRRIAEIVRSLGSFAGLDETEFNKTDVQASIDNTLTLLSRELRDRVAVTKEYGQIPQIHCCPKELHQMFMNLLRNCSEAIERKGSIGIETYAERGKVYVVISDSGKGIPPENINQIFDPGFTTKGAGVGTGLGLPITYNIVKRDEGEIKVESQLGEGTKVTVILPTNLAAPLRRDGEVRERNSATEEVVLT